MRIPVFVSSPTALNTAQSGARKVVIDLLDFPARALPSLIEIRPTRPPKK